MAPAPNYYQLLEIDMHADETAIKKAYRKVALVNHPDKTLHLPDAERARREALFKLTTTAQEVLTDAQKRRDYDWKLSRTTRPIHDYSSQSTQSASRQQESYYHQYKRPQASRWPKTPPPNSHGPSAWESQGFGGIRPPPNNGTPKTPFQYFTEDFGREQYQTITFRQPYYYYSLEELRVADYNQGRRYADNNGGAGMFGQNSESHPPHDYTTGSAPGMSGKDGSDAWFYAPVHRDYGRTQVTYSDWRGWEFTVGVSKRFEWVLPPVLPSLQDDTRREITIRLFMVRNWVTDELRDSFMTEVMVTVKTTPESRQTALSAIWVETRDGNVELSITLATASDDVQAATPPTASPSWTWAFDVDMGFLVPFYKRFRASHVMVYPTFPGHAVLEGGEVPESAPYPVGSPAAVLAGKFPGIQFAKLSKHFYCEEVWAETRRWRLVAVGWI